MNTRVLAHRIELGESFDYSLSFGDMEGISLNKDELMFRYAESEKDLESFLRFASKTLNLDDLIISGEQTDLGYKLSINESVVRPMSASEWIDLKFGKGRSHGTAQVKMMDDYAEYFHNIKVGNHLSPR
jgi:hypothetical protein